MTNPLLGPDPWGKGYFTFGRKKPMSYRTCKKLVDGLWTPHEFDDIKKGDHIRLWEPDGTFVATFKATSDAKPCSPPGNMSVEVKS